MLLEAATPAELPEAGVDKPDELRSEVAALLTQVTRLRSTRRALSLMRTGCCEIGLIIGLVYLWVALKAAGLLDGSPNWRSLVLIAAMTGGLGSLISSLSRLYLIRWRGQALLIYTHIFSLSAGLILNLLFASLQGIIFALILYAFFTTGILKEEIFPKIHWEDATGDFNAFLRGNPLTHSDTGKILVWSFAAGFVERLVPDLIRQLAAQSGDRPKKRPTATGDAAKS